MHRTHFASCLLLILCSSLLAQNTPERGRGAMIERLQTNLQQLGLTDDQKQKTDQILGEAADKLIELREKSQGDMESVKQQAGFLFRDVRQKIMQVLTPEQQKKLQELMPGMANRGPDTPRPRDPEPEAAKPESMKDTTMSGDTMSEMGSGKTSEPKPVAPKSPAITLAAGQQAPDFKLNRLDGKPFTLTNFRGKPTVLIFGSYTSPSFREHVADFEDIKKDYRGRVNVAVVYTREAYPANEWEVQRNLDQQISIPQTATLEDRQKLARDTQEKYKLSLDVLVEDMDDAASTAYGGVPNAAVVIDARGIIVHRQQWADAYGVRNLLDEALKPPVAAK